MMPEMTIPLRKAVDKVNVYSGEVSIKTGDHLKFKDLKCLKYTQFWAVGLNLSAFDPYASRDFIFRMKRTRRRKFLVFETTQKN